MIDKSVFLNKSISCENLNGTSMKPGCKEDLFVAYCSSTLSTKTRILQLTTLYMYVARKEAVQASLSFRLLSCTIYEYSGFLPYMMC